jgi:glutamate-ammonia-ligase adenylyltransferase
MQHRVPGASVAEAIETLEKRGDLSNDDAISLLESYRYCNRVRDRLFLLRGRPSDSLPTDPLEAHRLTESLGYESVAEMREAYRRTTRRAGAVIDRLFWGRDPRPDGPATRVGRNAP